MNYPPLPLAERDAQFLNAVADAHGRDSEAEHQVGDLEVFLGAAHRLLTKEQREAFFADEEVRETLAAALGIEDEEFEQFARGETSLIV